MNGTTTDTVASSWIEALGGLSMCSILSTPPRFWASAGPATRNAAIAASNATRPLWAFIVSSLLDLNRTLLLTHANCTPTVMKNSGRVQALRRGQRNREGLDGVERRRGDAGGAGEGNRGAHDRFDLHRTAEVVVLQDRRPMVEIDPLGAVADVRTVVEHDAVRFGDGQRLGMGAPAELVDDRRLLDRRGLAQDQ